MFLSLRLRLCCGLQSWKFCGDDELAHEGGELLTDRSVVGHACQLRELVQSFIIATESILHESRDVRSRTPDEGRFDLCGSGYYVDACEGEAVRRDERLFVGVESARMRTRALVRPGVECGPPGRDFSDDACARAMRESQTD